MFPNIDPRQMKQMMKKMGMAQEDIIANRVVIETDNGDIIINNPSVQKVFMQGNSTYQISGGEESSNKIVEEKVKLEITQEDIDLVSTQAKISKEEAKKLLEENNCDIAQAITKGLE